MSLGFLRWQIVVSLMWQQERPQLLHLFHMVAHCAIVSYLLAKDFYGFFLFV